MKNSGNLVVWNLKKHLWNIERLGFTPKKLPARIFPTKTSHPIFLTSMPKSGTHLLERILCLAPQIYRPVIPTLNPMNIEKYGGWEKNIEALKNGQLLVTHAHHTHNLTKSLDQSQIASFVMVRDPRAMVLSYAHYLLRDKSHHLHDLVKGKTISEVVDFSIDGSNEWDGRSFVDVMNNFTGWGTSTNTRVVRFEDIVATDTYKKKALVKTILTTAGVTVSERLIADIYAHAFSNVSPTFRNGSVDEWREVLSSSQKDRVIKKTENMMITFGYEE